ncbi:hypothetical protein AB4Y45_33900 [Paraburkholderia sp. EG287A]|uniref:hypothetical protein n=1 Tax=Paraburkholderia sp. EG287A TaxID=3237012 RepID=UPI0034D21B96
MSTTDTQDVELVEPGLTVDELRAQLGEISAAGGGAEKTFVQFRAASPRIGPSAAMPVTQATSGFDWNKGRVFISTAQMLTADDAELDLVRKHAQRLSNKQFLAMRVLAEDGLTDEERVRRLRKLFEPAPVEAPSRVRNN